MGLVIAGAADLAAIALLVFGVYYRRTTLVDRALLHPGLAANRWNRLLRTEFDWRRDASEDLRPH